MTTFLFTCKTCPKLYQTNDPSNFRKHCKGKAHLKYENGGEEYFTCHKCNYKTKVRQDYNKHLNSIRCIENHIKKKDKPIVIINELQKKITINDNKIDKIDDAMREIRLNNEMLFRVVYNSKKNQLHTNYTLPPNYIKLRKERNIYYNDVLEYTNIIIDWNDKIDKILLNSLNLTKFTTLKDLIGNWRMNLNM